MSKARFIETANYFNPSTSCLPNIVFEQAVVGASLDAYHYKLSAGAPAAHHAAGAHGPRAGGLLGLLIYKPQLGLLIPVELLAGRHWRASVPAGIIVPTFPQRSRRTWRHPSFKMSNTRSTSVAG
jgi:hypothetical protein